MVRRAFGGKFSDAEIEDIYANAWVGTLRALRNRPALTEPELRKYVLTAVANHASKELRRRGRRPTAPLDSAPEAVDHQATPDERVAIQEQTQITREILSTLPQRRRAVLMFRYAWGLKPEEVCNLVEGLSLRAYRKVDAPSSIAGAAAEPFAITAAQPLQALVNPEVDPVNFSTDASGPVNCQTDVVVSTQLENASPHLDAESAEVTLELPAGVQLISGPATQAVSAGVLEASTSTSETHTWTVRATSSGTKQLTITGSGETMGETFTSADQVSFDADCSPPTVAPTGTTVSSPGPVACGAERVISTTLRNTSITDASSAQVSLTLPAGAELVAGPASQTVSGGVLEAGTTSEAHSWTVRSTQPGLGATITGSGSDGVQTFSYPESVSIDCQNQNGGGGGGGGGPAGVALEITKAKMKRGKLIVAGTAASTAGPPPGEVTVELKGDEKKTKTGALRSGSFKIKQRICDRGRWRATAHYSGAAGFSAAISSHRVIKVTHRQISC